MIEKIRLKDNWEADDFSDFDEDLMSDKEREQLLENEVPGLDDSSPDFEIEPVYVPKGVLYKDAYRVPNISRDTYIQNLHMEALRTGYLNYSPLNLSEFVHIDRTLSIDFYLNEMTQILSIFKQYYGEGTLYVVNGFRSPHELGIGPHTVGVAIDLEAKDKLQAKRIMNAAYLTGIPTILPNGEFSKNEGYVHLDIAPKADYSYDGGRFDGPWSR